MLKIKNTGGLLRLCNGEYEIIDKKTLGAQGYFL